MLVNAIAPYAALTAAAFTGEQAGQFTLQATASLVAWLVSEALHGYRQNRLRVRAAQGRLHRHWKAIRWLSAKILQPPSAS